MPDHALTILCPLCQQPLDRQERVWACPNRHSFDVAREGYVNLLPVQHKHSREPGDSVEMVRARREFLEAGHYQPLREELLHLLRPLGAASLLDIGCGDGYYTSMLGNAAADVIGLDIAKPAIQSAARRSAGTLGGITWLVGSSAHLPFADQALDVVCSLFTPLNLPEMRRTLKSRGHVLIGTPASDHLWSIRERLFDEVRPHEPDKFLAEFAEDFVLVQRRELAFPLSLTQAALRQLLAMTPYAWKARPEKRVELEARASFATEAAFSLLLFQKR